MIDSISLDSRVLAELGTSKDPFSRFEMMVYIIINPNLSVGQLAKDAKWSKGKVIRLLIFMEDNGMVFLEKGEGKFKIVPSKMEQKRNSKRNSKTKSGIAFSGCDGTVDGTKTEHPDLTEEDHEIWNKFSEWLNKWTPRVQKLPTPLDALKVKKLRAKYPKEILQEVLMNMQNYKELHKKYVDAYLTANNWCERRLKNLPVDEYKENYSAQFHKS